MVSDKPKDEKRQSVSFIIKSFYIITDIKAPVNEAKVQRWEAEGEAKGKAEGEQAKAIEIARKMKVRGVSDDDIADVTGVSRAIISAL
jgi:hypothetical protein